MGSSLINAWGHEKLRGVAIAEGISGRQISVPRGCPKGAEAPLESHKCTSNVFFAPTCSLLLGQSSCPGMWSHFVHQASRLAKIPIGTLLSSIRSVARGSVRDQAGGKKCMLQLKTPIVCHDLGNVLAKGQRKQLQPSGLSHGSLEWLQPHTFVRLWTDFSFVSLNTSFSPASPSSPQSITVGVSSHLHMGWHRNHSLNQRLRGVTAASVNKVQGF